MSEALLAVAPQHVATETYPNEVNEQIESSGANPWSRIRQGIGRVALGLAMATGLVAAESATEIATGTEATAEAYTANAAEMAWCRWPSRFALCNRANQLGDKADASSLKVSKDTGWNTFNGGADAVRHCYWNALMTKAFGRSTASGFAWRHEYDENFGSDSSNMDLHNNLKGRDWANAKDPLKRCIQGVKSRELVILTKRP